MHYSNVVCPGNDILVTILDFVPVINSLDFQGPEHTVEIGGTNAQPSYCTLALFHAPIDTENAPAGLGYVSNDGHHFFCNNPSVMQPEN